MAEINHIVNRTYTLQRSKFQKFEVLPTSTTVQSLFFFKETGNTFGSSRGLLSA